MIIFVLYTFNVDVQLYSKWSKLSSFFYFRPYLVYIVYGPLISLSGQWFFIYLFEKCTTTKQEKIKSMITLGW